MKNTWIILLCCLLPKMGLAQTDTVFFSVGGGFYDTVFSLRLSNCFPENHIRFTTNGSRPTPQSMLYADSLTLNSSLFSASDIYTIQVSPKSLVFIPDSIRHCIVIRAAAFDGYGNCVSAVATQSFFIRALGCDTHGLPAISLCADSLDLFDYNRGIMTPGVCFDSLNPLQTGNYYQSGREWEREVNVEYHDYLDNSGINQTCGLRTHGNRARHQPQKGLKIYAREDYGKKRFNYRFFETCPNQSFKHLVIKPFSSLYPFSGIQDYICGQMAIDVGLESGHSRPVALFINGEYWGIYFLQEKMDERYLEDHLDIDIEHCDIVGNWNGLAEHGGPTNSYGDNIEFADMMEWLETADLTQESDYQYLCELIDIDNFMDYIILETFVANNDWPANNMRCWKMDGGTWRWMFYDGDATLNDFSVDPFGNAIPLDVFGNATYTGDYEWPSSRKATLLYRQCLNNPDFKCRFMDRIARLCHDVLSYENTSRHFFQVKNMLQPEIEAQSFRFGNPSSVFYWGWACGLAEDFLSDRVETYIAEYESFVRLDEFPEMAFFLCFPNPTRGKVFISCPTPEILEKVEVYNAFGQYVAFGEKAGDHFIMDLSNLPAGIYFVTVTNEDGWKCVQKVVKE